MSADISLYLAFSAGLLSFFSPCVLPLIPTYLTFLLGDYARQKQKKKAYSLLPALLFIASFSLIFILLGLSATFLGRFMLQKQNIIRKISGVLVIILGLHLADIINIKFLNYQKVGTQKGNRAPDFTLTSLQEEEVTLSDFRGKKVFLNFWASNCPPCREEMPDIEKLHQEFEEIEVLTVNVGESTGKINSFLMETDLQLPVLLDKDNQVAMDYLVRFIPTTYILDEEGIITDKVTGLLTYEQMLELLELEVEQTEE